MRRLILGAGATTFIRPPRAISEPVPLTVPASSVAPTISGYKEVGGTLTINQTVWDKSVDYFRYRWMRRPVGGSSWTTIVSDAPENSYTLAAADEGQEVLGSIFAYNAAGRGTRNANIIGPIATQPANAAPANVTPPELIGAAEVGEVLAARPGTWTGYPRTDIEYQWQRSADGVSWSTFIPRGSVVEYEILSSDIGDLIRVQAIRENVEGSTAWISSLATEEITSPTVPTFSEPADAALSAANGGIDFVPSLFSTSTVYGGDFLNATISHGDAEICGIETPYPPTEHVVHPFVVEMTPSFRGYRYLCAITALPGGVDYYEDAFLYGSNDRINWTRFPDSPWPFQTPANLHSYNSDTFMTQDPRTGHLIVGWREVYAPDAASKYDTALSEIRIKIRRTLDGVAWGPVETIYSVNQGVDQCRSPALLYDATREIWHMWAPDRPLMKYYSAPEITGPWTMTTYSTSFPMTAPTTTPTPHHGEVKWFGDKLVMLCSERWDGMQYLGILDPAAPTAVTWGAQSIITDEITHQLESYKASVLPLLQRDGTWRLGVWFTGIGGDQKVLRFGQSQEVFNVAGS